MRARQVAAAAAAAAGKAAGGGGGATDAQATGESKDGSVADTDNDKGASARGAPACGC